MPSRIVIAAGGTGGHLFPAQSLAFDLRSRMPDVELLFLAKGLQDNPRFNRDAFTCVDIASSAVTSNPRVLLKAFWMLPKGIFQAMKQLKRFSPDMVVGFGSFHTFPVLAAAYLLGIPIVLHEANRIPGKVNRLFSRFAAWTGIYFPDTEAHLKGKAQITDIPLRPQFYEPNRPDRESGLNFYGLSREATTILVFGGSLGAKKLNELAATSIGLLKSEKPIQVLHFTGSFQASQEVRESYMKAKIPHVVRDFESQMQYAWAAADLCLSRSGASTIAEQMTFAVPAVFIPYPFATDAHQEKNADYVVNTIGGAVSFNEKELEPRALASALSRLNLSEMQRRLFDAKKSMQSVRFCDLILQFLEEKKR